MDLNQLIGTASSGSVWLGVKAALVIGLILYNIFALVVIKQVKNMTDTLEVGFEGVIILISWLHFIFALGTLVAAIVIL
jgi:hypothetical protein